MSFPRICGLLSLAVCGCAVEPECGAATGDRESLCASTRLFEVNVNDERHCLSTEARAFPCELSFRTRELHEVALKSVGSATDLTVDVSLEEVPAELDVDGALSKTLDPGDELKLSVYAESPSRGILLVQNNASGTPPTFEIALVAE
jgi:hypothetical protein